MQGSEDDTSLLLDSSLYAHLPVEQREEVSVAAADKKRLLEKIAKLKKKVGKVKEARRKLNQLKQVQGGDEKAKREAWEESLLKAAEGVEEAPLSATGRRIVHLQGEHRKLQIRTKTIDGMMKPLQKNFNSLMEENKELRKKFAEVAERVKAAEANNNEMLQRRISADKRAEDLKKEKDGWMNTRAVPQSQGRGDFQGATRGILKILEQDGRDQQLLEDVREMINKMNVDALSESRGSLNTSLSSLGALKTPNSNKSRRRLLQGSLSELATSDIVSPAPSASSHSGL